MATHNPMRMSQVMIGAIHCGLGLLVEMDIDRRLGKVCSIVKDKQVK